MPEHTWLKLAKQYNEIKEIPQPATLISDNGISMVWLGGDGFVYKRSIPYLIENEMYFLRLMRKYNIVPNSERYDKITIKMEYLGYSESITDVDKFKKQKSYILTVLSDSGIRHGDITDPHVIIKNNSVFLLDWAESRLMSDPRPDKRVEGDEYWAGVTWRKMCKQQ